MSFHKDLVGPGNIHVPHEFEYADEAARLAATGFVTGDLKKLALQLDNFSLWMLTATTPTWSEVTSTGTNTLAEILAGGNTSGGSDIVMETGDKITLTDAPALGLDAANKDYVDSQVGTVDTLAEILAIGNQTGGSNIIVDTGDVITITDAPALGTDGANKDYVDAQVAGNDTFLELLDTPGSYVGQAGKVLQVNATPDGVEFGQILGTQSDIALNTTHRSSDGKDHSDVVLNNTHRGSAGTDHSDVVLNNAHRISDGKDHSDVVLNNTHRGSDGSDHSFIDQAVTLLASPTFAGLTINGNIIISGLVDGVDVGTDVPLNTTHRGSDGKDHSDVVLNNTHRASSGVDHSDVVLNNAHRISDGKDHSDVVLNNTHRGSDGSDHSFINQDVTTTGTPTFGITTLGDSSQLATSAAPTADPDIANKKYVDDQATKRAISLEFGARKLGKNTDDRWLWPGWQNLDATNNSGNENGYPAPFNYTITEIAVYSQNPAGNGNDVVYNVRQDNVTSLASVTLASTGSDAVDTSTVTGSAGDKISLLTTKAADIGSDLQDVTVTVVLEEQ